MMMLTFHLDGNCTECGSETHGIKMAWPERVNLGNIVIKQSVTFWKKDCHPGANVLWHGGMRLDDDSEALVEKAREKIRARRKRAA